MRDWLSFWKKQAPKDKILCGASPILNRWPNAKPDSIFTFQSVDNSHKFITDFLEISLPIEYKESELEYWDAMLQNIGKKAAQLFDFPSYVEDLFNRKTITANDILLLWAKNETLAYERWLLKAYALAYKGDELSGYMCDVLHEIDDFKIANTLFVNLTERIFYMTNAERLQNFDSRKYIMQSQCELFRTLVPEEHQLWVKNHIIEIAQRTITFLKQNDFVLPSLTLRKSCSSAGMFLWQRKTSVFHTLKNFILTLPGTLLRMNLLRPKLQPRGQLII